MSEAGNGAAEPEAVDPLLGTKVGNFRLVTKIGVGGMGVVYAAEHELMGKKAAVKLLLPELSSNKEIVGRFFNEARAATKINHPGIVDIYDFGYHLSGHAYIVMEFLAGESLAALMKKGLHFGRVVDISWQLGLALGAAHKRGIVHRDVKPDNIFVVPDPATPTGDRVKVLDFGIAKLTEDEPGVSLKTRTGAVMGTPLYMSPEQCKGSGEVDSRSDIYSMAVIMFEMVCGQPPFVRSGFGELITAHIIETPPRPSSLNPTVPRVYEEIVLRMLEKEPERRYQTAEEMIGDLATISLDTHATVAGMPTVVKEAGTGRSKLRRRRLSGLNRASSSGLNIDDELEPEDGMPRSRKKLLALAAGAAVLAVAVAAALTGAKRSTVEVTAPDPGEATSAARSPAPVEAEPSVRIQVSSTPSGASVVRAEDGAFLGKTPYQAAFPRRAKELALLIRQEGFVEQRLLMPLSEDGKAEVTLKAQEPPPSAQSQPAPVRVEERKGAHRGQARAGAEARGKSGGQPEGADGKGGKKKRNWGDLVD